MFRTRTTRRSSLRKRASHRRRALFQSLEARFCLAAAPGFESLPGADHIVFLDFDGHVVENTGWNSRYNQTTLTANPYDIDGDPSTFNATELAGIEEAFHRVAEDFRPFNVNVTTIEPSIDRLQKSGDGDTQWGIRVIVTDESTMVDDPDEYCGCGGIAYIGSFNNSGDLPAWAYHSVVKNVAEVISHEVGHSLGLSHDGTPADTYYSGHGIGDTGWAPIMGVGYSKNVTTWDDGSYYDTNNGGSGANYNKGPDDLAIITTDNGFGYRADDRGDDNANSSVLALSGATVDDAGVIETSSDVDVYTFTTAAGNVTLNVDSYLPGPNLDIRADLYDASGALVSSSNPATELNASISVNLAAGQYYLHVDGVGAGDPTSNTPTGYSDYASLGSYAITGSIVDAGEEVSYLSVDDVTVNEGAKGKKKTGVNYKDMLFSVNLSNSVNDDVVVNWSSADGNAVAGDDYETAAGKLTIPAGATSGTITVRAIGDNDQEPDESFFVNIVSVSGASVADGQGEGSILNDDTSGGNGGSGGRGNGKPNKASMDGLLVVDEVWYFEDTGHDHDSHDDTNDLAIELLAKSISQRDGDREDDVRGPDMVDEVHKLADFTSHNNRQHMRIVEDDARAEVAEQDFDPATVATESVGDNLRA